MIYFFLNPDILISSTISGSKLFLLSVFPSLFPFIFFSNLLTKYGGIEFYKDFFEKIFTKYLKLPGESSFPVILSYICGYPIGTKFTKDLFLDKKIDKNTFNRLLYIASTPSPLFVIGFVGVKLLDDKVLGYSFLITAILSSLIIAKSKTRSLPVIKTKQSKKTISFKNKESFGNILKTSLQDSLDSSLSIGTYIIIFSVIIALLKDIEIIKILINSSNIYLKLLVTLILGSLELTNGIVLISENFSTFGTLISICLINFLLGFSGFSILFQSASFVYDIDFFVFKNYVIQKFKVGLLNAFVGIFVYYAFFKISFMKISFIKNIFNLSSFNYILFIYLSILIIVLPFLIYKITQKNSKVNNTFL